MKNTIIILVFLLLSVAALCQPDTAANQPVVSPDTVQTQKAPPVYLDSTYQKLLDNPFIQPKGEPVFLVIRPRKRQEKDEIFYVLAGLLLLLAFIRSVFSKYFQNIFRVFFQPSFKQKQTREQLGQSSLPAFLLNIFFLLSGGLFIVLLLEYYDFYTEDLWMSLLVSTLVLLILYLGKYIFLSFAGWVFNVQDTTDTYIFIVFLINKIIGILLLPFMLLVAFARPELQQISITASVMVLILLFGYRYFAAVGVVRREMKINMLHFFLYVIAIEVIPLLVIYKSLRIFFNISL